MIYVTKNHKSGICDVEWILAAARDVKVGDTPAAAAASSDGDAGDDRSCPRPAKMPRTSLFASYRKPAPSAEKTLPLPSLVSSYLAYVQLILDGTEVGMPWQLVKNNKQFACLKPLFERIFCTPCTSAPVECVFSHGGLFIRPHRAKMSDQLLCDLMLAKCNAIKQ